MKAAKENLCLELDNLAKAKDALQYSFQKCQKIKLHEGLSYEELEGFEALTSRFARLSDIIIQKILRLLDFIDLEDVGTVRDRINRAEKKGVILSADGFRKFAYCVMKSLMNTGLRPLTPYLRKCWSIHPLFWRVPIQ